MALLRFRPYSQDVFRDVTDIQTQMNRLFDNFFGQPASSGMPDQVRAPVADMYETRNEVVVTAELPGLDEKDIHLSITGDLLTIQGERQWTGEGQETSYYRRERWFGKFQRSFTLPMPVQANQVKATYRDGVLTVTLPKADEIKPKEIKIEAR
ncbi:MAG TPA: Hsp20/alpha crystallin family protein [Methylomirabilota bacterium]|nr:Hsp20/alpha crystallin family protein [Methylomirabilota bacterium]